MNILINTLGILFAFGLVILIHEFGHFIVAKKSGVKVERFSFGLGPEMIGFQWGETRYCVAWLPLGGEVRMAGEIPEEAAKAEEDASRDKSRDFFAQPWYRRVAIAFAGPLMNYVLAVVIFFGMLMIWGEPTQINKTEIGEVLAGMPAEKAGFMKGDKILSVQNEPVEDFQILAQKINARPGLETSVEIQRGEGRIALSVVPEGEKEGRIGIRPAEPITEHREIGVGGAVTKAFVQCWNISYFTVYYLGQKIAAREKPDMAGPLGIGQVIVKAVKSGPEDFFYLIAMISVAIGLFNLFPVPLLDGGHVVYYVIEGIRGKPLSLSVMGKANMVGLAFLLSLLLFATVNDIQRFRGPKAETTANDKPAADVPVTQPEAEPVQQK